MTSQGTNTTKKDTAFDSIRANVGLYLPQYAFSTNPPPFSGDGALGYNTETRTPFYFNGGQWLPIITSSTINAFSFQKSTSQLVPPVTDTILSNWLVGPSPPYRLVNGWDLTQGVYTASADTLISVSAQVSWAANISNAGTRTLRVVYYSNATSTPSIAKEMTVQPQPDITVASDMTISMNLYLVAGDKVWISAAQTSSDTQSISSGVHTMLSGFTANVPTN